MGKKNEKEPGFLVNYCNSLYIHIIKVFIDDFGNKFSAPTGLLDLPISGIKIGRQFWRKIETSTIVKNTINILVDYAKEKGLMLIAVGVENREEMNSLRAIGINYMQGYIFAPQKDPNDFISDVKIKPWENILKRKSNKSLNKSEDSTDKLESIVEAERPVEESAEQPAEENKAEEEKPEKAPAKKKTEKPADDSGDKPAE